MERWPFFCNVANGGFNILVNIRIASENPFGIPNYTYNFSNQMNLKYFW